MWGEGKEAKAVERLKQFLNYIMFRRSGNHIQLPARRDVRISLEFNADEERAYLAAKQKTLNFIDDALNERDHRGGYQNALQKINDLRLICNHNSWARDPQVAIVIPVSKRLDCENWDEIAALKALDRFALLGISMTCIECKSLVEAGVGQSILDVLELPLVHITECLRLRCLVCYTAMTSTSIFRPFCDCDTTCRAIKVQLPIYGGPATPLPTMGGDMNGEYEYPTKILALLQDIQKLSISTKR